MKRLGLLMALAVLPSAGAGLAPVTVVQGNGTATFTNFSLPLVCPGFTFDIEMTIVGDQAVVTMQAQHPDPFCNNQAIYYSVNPVTVSGDWTNGWVGEAVGVGVIWPEWPVYIGGAYEGEDGISLHSYYVDVNGRQYLFEGAFDITWIS